MTSSSEKRLPTCVLTFHRVVNAAERYHDVEWPIFLRLVRSLNPARVATDLVRAPEMSGAIVLTFDDATSDHARVGEELASLGLQAIFFLPSRRLGESDRLTHSDVGRLLELGHEVGGHGFSHTALDLLTESQLEEEITRCVSDLTALVGSAPRWFAPPGGRTHPTLLTLLETSGFAANRTMRWGHYRSTRDRWRIPCVPVTQFTIQSGWVDKALTTGRLPLAMRAGYLAKSAIPIKTRQRARRYLVGFRGQRNDKRTHNT